MPPPLPPSPDRKQNGRLALFFVRGTRERFLLSDFGHKSTLNHGVTFSRARRRTHQKKGCPTVRRQLTLGEGREGRKSGVHARNDAGANPFSMMRLHMLKCLVPITCSNRVYLHIAAPPPICFCIFKLSIANIDSLHLNSVFSSENGGYTEHQLIMASKKIRNDVNSNFESTKRNKRKKRLSQKKRPLPLILVSSPPSTQNNGASSDSKSRF